MKILMKDIGLTLENGTVISDSFRIVPNDKLDGIISISFKNRNNCEEETHEIDVPSEDLKKALAHPDALNAVTRSLLSNKGFRVSELYYREFLHYLIFPEPWVTVDH